MATTDSAEPEITHKPYVPDEKVIPEFTWPSVIVGAILGIVFGASSLYLLLKVGMTVSASVPIAVLSITLFRAFSRGFGFRRATILENNIVQTTGSAGESIAFGVGVTMPALLLLGFEMSWVRVMTVSVLGGLLGILMMIPLRRAFIVKQHGKLKYPEGTACAEVLTAGERGGSSAKMVFIGFGIAFVYKLLNTAFKFWPDEPSQNLYATGKAGGAVGLKGAAVHGELSPELMGVGYLIGPRIANLMMAGAVLAFWVIGPLIATFGENASKPVPPAMATDKGGGMIAKMGPKELKANYLRYIGAGAVAAGGIISMCRALPLIIGSIVAGLRDLRPAGGEAGAERGRRTERDLPMTIVIFGSIALVVALAAVPQLGLGLTTQGLLAAAMILLFGFLFVTVSSRLTGEVGSSSNPISGMTIATLLLTCLVFVMIGYTDRTAWLTALSIAGVVCIASSNGGTTSQDLKTGFLVGATPKYQQWAILIGTLTSAIVIGGTMMALNFGGTHYTKKNFEHATVTVPDDAPRQKAGQPYVGEDDKEYRAVYAARDQYPDADVPEGWYLADETGKLTYKVDVPINRKAETMDNGREAPKPFQAPQPQLFAVIIEGILGGKLQWALVGAGALIAVVIELMGIGALPVAVGMYLGLGTALPIFIGGLIRWAADRARGVPASEAESETSSGVLLSSGYIAGGTLCGLLWGFVVMGASFQVIGLSEDGLDKLNYGDYVGRTWNTLPISGTFTKGWEGLAEGKLLAVAAFASIGLILFVIGRMKSPPLEGEDTENIVV